MQIFKKRFMKKPSSAAVGHVEKAIAKMDLSIARLQQQNPCVLLRTDYLE